MPDPFGVDVAFGNALDSSRIAALDFAISRIGTLGYSGIATPSYYNKYIIPDSAFLSNVANVQAASKPCGCYFFSYAWDITSAVFEANKVCDVLDANSINLEMPVFFDWERTGAGTQGSYEMVTAAGVTVTPALVQDITLAFMQRVNERHRTTGWYGNLDSLYSFYTQAWTTARMAENYYFWLAEWGPNYSTPCDVWQYDGDVQWMGIDADLNYLIDPRCVNGQIGHHVPRWLLAMLSGRRNPRKSFRKEWMQ